MIADEDGNIITSGEFTTDENGNISLDTDIDEAGTYTLTVTYDEENKHGKVSVSSTFTVTSSNIESAKTDANVAFPADVYDLSGKLVRKQAKSLDGFPAGIYVVNGKKVAVQ